MKTSMGLMSFRALFRAVALVMVAMVPMLFMAADAECSFGEKKKDKKVSLPKDVDAGLNYLFTFLAGKDSSFDGSKIKALIKYVDDTPETDKIIKLPKRDSSNGAAMRLQVNAGLKRILEYTYNPEIPNYALYPSVIRVSGWHADSQFAIEKAQPWKYLDDCDTPRVWRGKEFEVNTPDSFGGGYYRYDLNRLLVLLKYEGRDVFLSVSKQMDKSSVGMKGLVVDDNQWNYFYSGIPGLTSGGMGWMDTFMYDSMAVNLFIQDKNNPAETVSYLFKWLSAGWAGLNVVRPKHIFEGSQRFGRAFSDLMESNGLPTPKAFAEKVREIEAMSDQDIDHYISEYSKQIEHIAAEHPVLSDKFPEVYENGRYADKFTREERIGVLVKEYVKQAMGKQCLIYEKVVSN
ncbi:hypothetical protein [Desulfovibrio sp. JC010]|uniref:hypothetical protein n=1 Tax=Desulfovibrio sp. JC010 TaxID=2593641 RepID=UPI0013D52B73|nr:hypothetical protein [Desulfovibrio sp. JC010]NDV25890.1 hypothetical protein [Desulfovibrio sp. JC010]